MKIKLEKKRRHTQLLCTRYLRSLALVRIFKCAPCSPRAAVYFLRTKNRPESSFRSSNARYRYHLVFIFIFLLIYISLCVSIERERQRATRVWQEPTIAWPLRSVVINDCPKASYRSPNSFRTIKTVLPTAIHFSCFSTLARHHKQSQNRKRKSNKLTFGIFVLIANQGKRMRCHSASNKNKS